MERQKKVRMFIIFSLIVFMIGLQNCSDNSNKKKTDPFQTLEEQVRDHPKNVQLIVKLAKMYQFNGHPERAIDLLKQKKAEIPDNPTLEIWYANAESMMASKAEKVQDKVKWSQFAIADLDQTVEKYPENWYVHFIRGKNSLNWPDMFHRKEVAIQDFNYLLKFDQEHHGVIPDSIMSDIMYSLAKLYQQKENAKEKALKLLNLIVDKYPNSEEAAKIKALQTGKNY